MKQYTRIVLIQAFNLSSFAMLASMTELLPIMRRLRGPGGCPWDQQQTHKSLRPYLLEEAAEAVDALATSDVHHIAEELGDVLLQVAFHAVIAEEAGTFRYEDIEQSIVQKLVRRHPHVFGDVAVSGADEVVTNWQAIKEKEKELALSLSKERGGEGEKGRGVPQSLPALMRAYELGKKLEWPALRLNVTTEKTPTPETMGELLLAVVDYARSHKINPELALRDAANKRAERQE
jgi:XTP/dITP diphosphohydrolase